MRIELSTAAAEAQPFDHDPATAGGREAKRRVAAAVAAGRLPSQRAAATRRALAIAARRQPPGGDRGGSCGECDRSTGLSNQPTSGERCSAFRLSVLLVAGATANRSTVRRLPLSLTILRRHPLVHSGTMPDRQIERALREAILADPASYNELAKLTGVSRPTITRFIDDERSLRFDLAAILCEHYELELTKRKD